MSPDQMPGADVAELVSDDEVAGIGRQNYGSTEGWILRLPPLEARIDVRPNRDDNVVQPSSRRIIPVAILGSEDFDVAGVDVTTLVFGPDEAAPVFDLTHPFVSGRAYWDVDGDDENNLLSHYRTDETGIAMGDTEACLIGELQDRTPFEGCDAITTVPGCGQGFEAALVLPPLVWFGGRIRRRQPSNQHHLVRKLQPLHLLCGRVR